MGRQNQPRDQIDRINPVLQFVTFTVEKIALNVQSTSYIDDRGDQKTPREPIITQVRRRAPVRHVTRRQPIITLVQNSSFRTALYMGGASSGRRRRLKKPSYTETKIIWDMKAQGKYLHVSHVIITHRPTQ